MYSFLVLHQHASFYFNFMSTCWILRPIFFRYYDLRQLKRDFPKGIKGYESPPMHLPGSILNLSNTGGAGRGSDKGTIIGEVINHGKRQYWTKGENYHYHCTLQKGENTLEAQLARVLMRSVVDQKGWFHPEEWLKAFETFLTTPGTHNDTYASTYIRMFFRNRLAGRPLTECADNDSHNVDAIDALTLLPPVILAAKMKQTDEYTAVASYLSSTRKSRILNRFGDLYCKIFLTVLNEEQCSSSADEADGSAKSKFPAEILRTAALDAAQSLDFDLEKLVSKYQDSDPMTACYIDSSFRALLVFIYKYADDPVQGLLASVNAGGENVARSAVLGALFGATYGTAGWPTWCTADLKDTNAISSDIASFLEFF